MKAKALAVLIPALFLATSSIAQTAKEPAASDKPHVPTAQDRAHNREAVSDTTITGKVKTALAADVGLKTVTGINVDTDHGGVVTLTGKVDSADVKKRAEQVVKKVGGVKSVKNNLTVTKG
jgi:hyperosmotically inducible periplasmic protein